MITQENQTGKKLGEDLGYVWIGRFLPNSAFAFFQDVGPATVKRCSSTLKREMKILCAPFH